MGFSFFFFNTAQHYDSLDYLKIRMDKLKEKGKGTTHVRLVKSEQTDW